MQLFTGNDRDYRTDDHRDDFGDLCLRYRFTVQMNGIVTARTDHLIDRRVQQQQQRDLVEQQMYKFT